MRARMVIWPLCGDRRGAPSGPAGKPSARARFRPKPRPVRKLGPWTVSAQILSHHCCRHDLVSSSSALTPDRPTLEKTLRRLLSNCLGEIVRSVPRLNVGLIARKSALMTTAVHTIGTHRRDGLRKKARAREIARLAIAPRESATTPPAETMSTQVIASARRPGLRARAYRPKSRKPIAP